MKEKEVKPIRGTTHSHIVRGNVIGEPVTVQRRRTSFKYVLSNFFLVELVTPYTLTLGTKQENVLRTLRLLKSACGFNWRVVIECDAFS